MKGNRCGCEVNMRAWLRVRAFEGLASLRASQCLHDDLIVKRKGRATWHKRGDLSLFRKQERKRKEQREAEGGNVVSTGLFGATQSDEGVFLQMEGEGGRRLKGDHELC